MYDLNYTTDLTNQASTGMFETIFALMTTYFIFILILSLVLVVAHWKLYTKAGKPGWAILIPIYGDIVKLQIAGLSPLLILAYLIPVVNVVVLAYVTIKLARAFGKDDVFGILMYFFGFIFIPILAFGSAKYVGKDGNLTNAPAPNNASPVNEPIAPVEPIQPSPVNEPIAPVEPIQPSPVNEPIAPVNLGTPVEPVVTPEVITPMPEQPSVPVEPINVEQNNNNNTQL